MSSHSFSKIPGYVDGTSDPQVMQFFKSICEVVTTTSQTLCRLVGIMCILMHTCISFPDAIENRS